MHLFTLLFLLALAAGLLLQYWLIARQSDHVARHRLQVPAPFSDRISLAAHTKAADYTQARLALEKANLLIGSLLLIGWTLGGGIELLAQLWIASGWEPLWAGVGLLLSLLLIGSILDLPLDLWRTFGIEAKFGFNRTTPKRFITDLALQFALLLILGTPLLAVILWLMASAGAWWWLAAWGVWMGFTLLITWAYPTLIAPLFNRFSPLAEGELRERLEQLLERCGFSNDGMFVMDGSSRSAHGNAYFTGFGRHKRIVFFDTLLQGMEYDEVEAILAHELGHFKRRHVLKSMSLMAFGSLAGMALLGWLSGTTWFYQGLGVTTVGDAQALALFMLALPVFTQFLQPVFSAISRRHEFEADDYAAAQANPRALISGLVKMYRDNASTLTPDPIYSAFHHSHPPAPVRIAHLSSKL